jgi:excisionase family DNA binding protein
MGQVSVSEAAKRLGVGVSRVHQRIADGSLPAVRIGSQWILDEAALSAAADSSRPGRPLSRRSAWALVAVSQPDPAALEALAPAERSRARKRLDCLLASSPVRGESSEAEVHMVALLLRSWLRNRAERHLYRASPRDLPDLREDNRVVLSGLSHPGSGIASGNVVEGYVSADDVRAVMDDYLLSSVPVDKDANVVLHVVSVISLDVMGDIAPLLLAADLAEHRGPREESRAVEILKAVAAARLSFLPGEQESLRVHGEVSA